MDVHIDDSEMMTQIMPNLPEEYQNTVDILEYKLDDEEYPLTAKNVFDKLLVKYDRMNKQSRPKMSRECEKYLYVNPNTRVPA